MSSVFKRPFTWEFGQHHWPRMQNVHFQLMYVAQNHLCLSFLLSTSSKAILLKTLSELKKSATALYHWQDVLRSQLKSSLPSHLLGQRWCSVVQVAISSRSQGSIKNAKKIVLNLIIKCCCWWEENTLITTLFPLAEVAPISVDFEMGFSKILDKLQTSKRWISNPFAEKICPVISTWRFL